MVKSLNEPGYSWRGRYARTNGHGGVNEVYLKYEIGQQLSFGEQNTEVIMAKLKRSGLCQTNYSAAVGATVQNV